jgi:hypothetical protein
MSSWAINISVGFKIAINELPLKRFYIVQLLHHQPPRVNRSTLQNRGMAGNADAVPKTSLYY